MAHHYSNTPFKLLFISFLALCWQASQAHEAALPVSQGQSTMMEVVIKERPVLADLLTRAGLAPLLSADASITLLAPPESVLQSMKQESPQRLRVILSAHILKGTFRENDLKDGATLTSIGGAGITVCRKKDHTLVNGVRIQEANHMSKNGVLHGLSGMIRI